MSTSAGMAKYKCHKEVHAVKIQAIILNENSDTTGQSAASSYGAQLISVNNQDLVINVDAAYMNKHNPQVGGYFVLYEDDYVSYSPAAAFEGGYTLIPHLSEGFSFGDAIQRMREGKKVARAGWNGKRMWLMLVPASLADAVAIQYEALKPLPWVGMRTADECFVPWLASQTDVLANDWEVIQ